MVLIKTWNDFELFRSSSRKLVIYGADNDYKENLIDFFKNEPILFCDKNADELSSFKESLDVVIFSTVEHKNIPSLIRIFNTFTFEIYLYIGDKNQRIQINGNQLSYLRAMLLNKDIKNIYSEIDVPLYEYFVQIDKEQSEACGHAIIDYTQNISLRDFLGKYTNHLFGKRVTCYQPKHCRQNIHVFGDSRVYGFGVEDKFTFCSLLQKVLNEENYESKVINHGIPNYLLEGLINRMSSVNLTSSDTVLLCISFASICRYYDIDADTLIYLIVEIKNKCISYGAEFIYVNLPTIYDINERSELENRFLDKDSELLIANYSNDEVKQRVLLTLKENLINVVDTTKYFNHLRVYSEVFLDDHHFLNSGNQLIAQAIFDSIDKNEYINKNNKLNIKIKQNNNIIQIKYDLKYKMLLEKKYESEFFNYLNSIKKHTSTVNEIIGSIVVNCNPFTYGHLQIIEYASLRVDFLYIFVLEEDSSYFSFEDRIFLAKENTKHIKNIIVNPSGQNIISKVTFPEYFAKENLKDKIVDCSNDLMTFGSNIAPALNITKRFVGSEPFCNITRQYNKKMKKILPKYNIDVIEVERFSVNNEYISASEVRKLLNDKNFSAIKKLVPKVTYNLIKNYECMHSQ